MNEELNPNVFGMVKALSDLQIAVSKGHAELAGLKKEEGEYMRMREIEGNKKVATILKESHEALDQASKNYERVREYGEEVFRSAETLSGFSSQVSDMFKDFREWVVNQTRELDKKRLELDRKTKEAILFDGKVKDGQRHLRQESLKMLDEMKLLRDRRAMLERGFAELKTKQQQP